MFTQKVLMLCKVESTAAKGTEVTPTTAANAFLASDVNLSIMGEKIDRNLVRGSLGQVRPLIGKKWAELTFTTELKGSATRGTPPREGPLFRACALTESTTTTTGVTYAPHSAIATMITATIWVNVDGVQHKMNYCTGNLHLVMEAGQPAKCNWSMKGIYNAPAGAAITTATFDAVTLAVPVHSAVFKIGNVEFPTQTLELNLNNVVAEKTDVSAANSIKGFDVVNRNIGGSFNPEIDRTQAVTAFATWTARSSGTMTIVLPGAASGNTITITGQALYFDSVGYSDKDGIRILEIPFQCATSAAAGDDEIAITIT